MNSDVGVSETKNIISIITKLLVEDIDYLHFYADARPPSIRR